MLRAILLSTLLLTGCGPGFKTVQVINKDFKEYVEKFEYVFGVDVDLGMLFADLDGNVIGRCRYNKDYSFQEIAIDTEWWEDASDLDREILVFHELSHCTLRQGHRDYTLPDECPGSVMNTYRIGAHCYYKHYEYYIGELRDGKSTSHDHSITLSDTRSH